jgi:YrbI family 3-deoxy-D-manno-octulosonate 8-phosphate phosphatase
MPNFSLEKLQANLQFLQAAGKLSLSADEQALIQQKPGALNASQLLSLSARSGIGLDRLLQTKLGDVPKDLKMLIMDCDGVLTDGGMTFSKNGDEIKRFNAKDGMGIKRLHKAGWQTGIISAGISTGLVEKRAEMLGIKNVYVGKDPKLEILKSWLAKWQLPFSAVVYIGDDVSDLPILEQAGFSTCPADAVKQVKNTVHQVLETKGGEGCVRELIDEYLLPS